MAQGGLDQRVLLRSMLPSLLGYETVELAGERVITRLLDGLQRMMQSDTDEVKHVVNQSLKSQRCLQRRQT